MPRLEQTKNGNYIIRARLYNSKGISTWQVMAGGVTFLHRRGIHAGDQFTYPLLQELIEQHLVFTGGSGVRSQVQKETTNTIPIRKGAAQTTVHISFKMRQPSLKSPNNPHRKQRHRRK